jgi:anti-sigma-K factor RskA
MRRVVMTRVMSDDELQKAIQDANEALNSLTSPYKSKEPFPEHEVRRREIILLRQVTAYKILRARGQGEKDLELFNIAIYDAMTSFLESYQYDREN